MTHWLIEVIRDVHARRARPVCLWAILCTVIGHDDDPDAIVPGLGQCRRCYLNAPYGDMPRGWVP
jgi:hypothetical protein